MSLTKRSENKTIFLAAKHFCLWDEVKEGTAGAEQVEVKNPTTGAISIKWGFRFDSVEGRATKLVKYDTEKKYAARYFGFKLHLQDGIDSYVLDMPYQSQMLRRFLRAMPNINWNEPLSITVFQGRKRDSDKKEMGVWFRQHGDTVKPYYTREQPHGMPEATFDKDLNQWDFKLQHRWLVDVLREQTIPDIEEAAKRINVPADPHLERSPDEDWVPDIGGPPYAEGVTDEDVPF